MFGAIGTRWVCTLLLTAGLLAVGDPTRAEGLVPLVVEVRAQEPIHASLAAGAEAWLRVELDAQGLPAPGAGDPSAVAQLRGELRVAEGQAELRLHLEDGQGRVQAGARRRGALLRLGSLTQQTAVALLERLRVSGDGLRSVPAPSLEELARTGRVLAWMEGGDLALARRELAHRGSRLAGALLAEIDSRAQAPGTSEGESLRVLLLQGQVPEVERRLRAAPQGDKDARLLLAAAELERELSNPRRERESLARAAAQAPDDAEVQLAYGLSLAQVSPDEARPVLKRAAALRPDDPAPLEALARLPGAGPEPRRKAAERAMRRFERSRAVGLYARDPAQASAQRRVGEMHLAVGDDEQALLAFERAVELEAGNAAGWKGLARAQQQAGDLAGAEAAYQQALERTPDDADALRGVGSVRLASGRPEEARPALERAVALAPEDDAARLELGRALRRSGEPERALEVLEGGEAPSAERLRGVAALHRERGDAPAASRALERAIELDPGDPELHEALAEVREAAGEAELADESRGLARVWGGEGAVAEPAARAATPATAGAGASFDGPRFLAPLAASFPQVNERSRLPVERVAFLGVASRRDWRGWLELGVLPKRIDRSRLERDLLAAFGSRFEIGPVESQARAAYASLHRDSPARGDVAAANAALGTHAVMVARLVRAESNPNWREAFSGEGVEVRMLVGGEPAVVAVFANAQGLTESGAAYLTWNPVALGLWGLVLVAMGVRVIRGWGGLEIQIDYEQLGAGFFTARVSRKPGRVKSSSRDRKGRGRRRFRGRLREFGRFQRSFQDRKATFGWLPARTYHVAVHGLLEHPITKEVIGRYFDEKPVLIERGKRTQVMFDFRPTECSVEVAVSRGGAALERVQVAVEGMAGSLRYASSGSANLELGKGRHTVLAGHEGRVVSQRIRIDTLEPTRVTLDMEDEDALVFDGCPEAVEPFLSGAREATADLLEAAGQTDVARKLRGDVAAARGDRAQAAQLFEDSGRFAEAAQAWLAQSLPERAAACFERLQQLPEAAEAWRAAGEVLRAGRAYEEAGDYEAAIDCYHLAGERERLAALLEKSESFVEAAEVALEEGNADRAIANLQRVSPVDPNYAAACRKLADIFGGRGEAGLAIAKLDEAVAAAPSQDVADLQQERALLLEAEDRLEEAVAAWEEVRQRDFHRPQAAERLEALRAQLDERAEAATRAQAVTRVEPADERYEIQGELGRGGMGIVYKAFDTRLSRTVAIKRLPENLREHPKAVELFLREARAAGQLNHPNIVTVHDVDQHDGAYFITMECMDGLPLNTLLQRHGRFPVPAVAKIGLQVCAGLGFAHSSQIVHRDIKTSNLFMTREKVVKVMDFGLARSMAEVRRAGTVIGGTPNYMAPEQAAGDEVDARADLYALGVTLFELATGGVPFTEGDVTYHHRHTAAPDPRERVADLPAPLAELILALMAKRPEDRPASAAEVAACLKPLARAPRRG